MTWTMMHIDDTLTTPALIARAAARHGAHPAIESTQGNLTYAELNDARLEAARALLARGIEAGDRIAIWAPNLPLWIVAALAIHTVGAVLVPVNTRMKGLEVGGILQDSGARLLFCCDTFLGESYPAMLAPHRPATLEHIVMFDGVSPGSTEGESWNAFIARGGNVSLDAVCAKEAAVTADTVMDLMFTSGTTGRPKGVMTSHGQNLRAVRGWAEIAGVQRSDRYLIVNPFFHTFGYKAGWLAALSSGATVLPHLVFQPDEVLRRVADERVSVLPGPPTLYYALLDAPERTRYDLSSLRIAVTGAAAIAPSLIERMRAELGFETVLTGYGLTESCGFATLCRHGDDVDTVAQTSGRPMPEVEIRIAGDGGVALGPDETGEIWVRGYNVMRGYFNEPGATRETIDADGWLHTGDLGRLDANGNLRITDRIKDMFIVGGFNCYPAEIERLLAAHPTIAQVALVGEPDARLGEVGHAYIVLRPGAQASAEELSDWSRKNMANYKVPRRFTFLERLPTSASGKVLKYKLRTVPEGESHD